MQIAPEVALLLSRDISVADESDDYAPLCHIHLSNEYSRLNDEERLELGCVVNDFIKKKLLEKQKRN